jgi:hypothetical protein
MFDVVAREECPAARNEANRIVRGMAMATTNSEFSVYRGRVTSSKARV